MHIGSHVVYEIYPKSFCDSNHDGIGDIRGILTKLDYLKELNVDCLWLTPFFESPQLDNGYDISDYFKIDPRYGTMADFDELIKQTKSRDMTVMLDMVFNHTSTAHPWFQKALAGDPVYQNYYFFKESKDGKVPTNWVSKFGGSTWEYVPNLDLYYLHLFGKTQADLNWDNPAVRKEMADILQFWMDKGVKGFRFDVINLISKPSVFTNDDQGDGRRFYTDGLHVHEYLKELNQATFGKDPSILTVGEMSSTDIANCILYAGEHSNQLNMAFSFHHLKADYLNGDKWKLKPFDFAELKQILNDWQIKMTENNAWNALFWNNHDQPRAVSRFCSNPAMQNRAAKMLASCIHFMRGTPYIYQGEEIGMRNPGFDSIDQYRDIESLNYYDILKATESEETTMKILQERSRDNSRTPMQWDSSMYAGFSASKPWIAVCDDYQTINVENETNDPDSVLSFYKAIISLRKSMPIIQEGDFHPLLLQHPAIFAYRRTYNKQNLIVLCNFYDQTAEYELDTAGYRILLSNIQESSVPHALKPYETLVLLKDE